MVMARNFQHGRKYEVSGKRKTQVEIIKEKERKQYTAPAKLQSDVLLRWQEEADSCL